MKTTERSRYIIVLFDHAQLTERDVQFMGIQKPD